MRLKATASSHDDASDVNHQNDNFYVKCQQATTQTKTLSKP